MQAPRKLPLGPYKDGRQPQADFVSHLFCGGVSVYCGRELSKVR